MGVWKILFLVFLTLITIATCWINIFAHSLPIGNATNEFSNQSSLIRVSELKLQKPINKYVVESFHHSKQFSSANSTNVGFGQGLESAPDTLQTSIPTININGRIVNLQRPISMRGSNRDFSTDISPSTVNRVVAKNIRNSIKKHWRPPVLRQYPDTKQVPKSEKNIKPK